LPFSPGSPSAGPIGLRNLVSDSPTLRHSSGSSVRGEPRPGGHAGRFRGVGLELLRLCCTRGRSRSGSGSRSVPSPCPPHACRQSGGNAAFTAPTGKVTGRSAPTTLHLGMGWFPDEPGGLNRYVRGLVEALTAAGADTAAVVLGPARDAPSYVEVAADSLDPLPHRLLAYARAARRKAGVDLVDAHFAFYALLQVALGPLRKLPLVVHFHGPWELEGRANGQRGLRPMAKRLTERVIYRRADEAVVLSRAFGHVLTERYGVSPWRVNVIPPGVNLERFSPGDRGAARRELGLPLDVWTALTVRRLIPRMGIDTLIDAWRRLPLDGALLLVAGDGPLRAPLERDAPANVHFLGQVDERLLPMHYRAADAVVVPSRSLEGFGLVVLEALACGTPVIVTDAGGLPEAVEGLEGNLVVPAGDVEALAERLAAAANGSKPLPTPRRARAHAERFTWSRAAEQHGEVYRRAVRGGRRLPLRVVYLDHTAALSGGELALLRLLPALKGVDAHVMLAEDGKLVRSLEAAGVSVEVLPLWESTRRLTRRQVEQPSFLAAGAATTGLYSLQLARRLRRLKPDLVHTNSLKSALYGGVAGRLAGIPVVWHVRDRIAPDYLGARATRAVQSAARRIPTAVIANSRTTLASLGVDGHVIPSPLVLGPPSPRAADGPFTVGIVGRIARWKGQHVFVEAFARAFPDGAERALVIGAPLFGADDQAYENEVRELVARLGLTGRVAFTGFVEDIPSWLSRLDVLVHASVVPEPFGQVVVEGLAAGVPVVASRAGGPAEIIEDGVNGFLVQPGDVTALADTMTYLAHAPEMRASIGARGRQSAKRFDVDQIAAEVRELYEQVVYRRVKAGGLSTKATPR
jgi:glycosyltransferase involved in cell wall biosynthesis